MKSFLKYVWRKMPESHDVRNAGPIEKAFFESVYRLVFAIGASTSDDHLAYTIFSCVVRGLSSLIVCLEIWSLVANDDLNLDDMISSANVILIHVITIWRLMIMVSHKNVFRKLAKALESPSFDISTQGRKNIMKYWADTQRRYLRILLTIGYTTLIVWLIFPLMDEVEFNLMVEVKIPFKYEGYPKRYHLTYIVVGIMFFYASLLVIMAEAITQSHMISLICQFDVLANCFENIVEDTALEFQASFPEIKRNEMVKNHIFVEKYLKRLGDLVKQHQSILVQTTDLQAILSNPLLGQLTCSGILICFVGYQATTTITQNLGKFAMSLLYLSYNMFTQYLICKWCEEITVKSQNLGQSAYFSAWESGIISHAPGARATLILVIARSNKPLVFLAGGMYPLSLSSYSSLVKASYSALNLLLSTNHE